MPKIVVEGPDGKKYAFPDTMPREQINTFMKERYGTKARNETVNDYLARVVREQDATKARAKSVTKEATAAGRAEGERAAERMGVNNPFEMAMAAPAIGMAQQAGARPVFDREGTMLADEAAGLAALNTAGFFIPGMVNQRFGERTQEGRRQQPAAAFAGDVAGGMIGGELIGLGLQKAGQAIAPGVSAIGRMLKGKPAAAPAAAPEAPMVLGPQNRILPVDRPDALPGDDVEMARALDAWTPPVEQQVRPMGFDPSTRLFRGTDDPAGNLDGLQNPDGYHGAGIYLTTSTDDAAKYSTRGAGKRAELMDDQIALAERAGDQEAVARLTAQRSRMAQPGTPTVSELRARMKNPVTLDNDGGTVWQPAEANRLIDALVSEIDDAGITYGSSIGQKLKAQLQKDGRLTASDFERIVREEADADFIRAETSPGQVISQAYQALGHDGVVMKNAADILPKGSTPKGTTHVTVFNKTLLQSMGARGSLLTERGRDAVEQTFGAAYMSGTGSVAGGQYDLNGDGEVDNTDLAIGSGIGLAAFASPLALRKVAELGGRFKGTKPQGMTPKPPETPQQAARYETPGSPEYEAAIAKGLDMSTPARMARAKEMGAVEAYPDKIASALADEIEAAGLVTEVSKSRQSDSHYVKVFFPDEGWGADYIGSIRISDHKLPSRFMTVGDTADMADPAIAQIIVGSKTLDLSSVPDALRKAISGKGFSVDNPQAAINEAAERLGRRPFVAKREGIDPSQASTETGGTYSTPFVLTRGQDGQWNIRSVNAAFDPDKAASPILTAGLGGKR